MDLDWKRFWQDNQKRNKTIRVFKNKMPINSKKFLTSALECIKIYAATMKKSITCLIS